MSTWSEQNLITLIRGRTMTDSWLANAIGRPVGEIPEKRAELAARMHSLFPQKNLRWCSVAMSAPKKPNESMDDYRGKQNTMLNSVEALHRRNCISLGAVTAENSGMVYELRQIVLRGDPEVIVVDDGLEDSDMGAIKDMCRILAQENGRMSQIFSRADLAPFAVKYYAGLESYALHLRGI